LPKDWRCGGEAAYWLPILAIFTGARLSELAQLKPTDIDYDCEIPTLSISNLGVGQQVKTEAAIRKIPVHSELIRLGFLDHVKNTVANDHALLWNQLKFRKNKPGGNFSNWFGEFRKALELPQGLDFHSFRHGVRSQLAENDVPEPIIDSVMGHQISGSTGAKVYSHRTLNTIKTAIEKIEYKNLILHNLFHKPVDMRYPKKTV
jgi:integrase